MIRPPIDLERFPAPIKISKELAKFCEKRCICSEDPNEDIKGINPIYDKWCKENCICRHYIHYEYKIAEAVAV